MSADISGPSSGPEFDPAARRAEVLDAARDIAARFELGEVEPEVLYDLFSVVVHLRPTPVVLRVPTVLPRGFADDLSRRERRQVDELAVAAWLVDRGFPTMRPSALLPQRPLRSGRWTATAWEYVKHYESGEAAVAELADQIVPMVIRLHIELESYPEPLPFLAFWDDTLADLITELDDRPDLLPAPDTARLRREHTALSAVLGSEEAFRGQFPEVAVQVIHGDAPTYNLARTTDGVLITDFELVTRGPIEWDLTLLGDEGQTAYSAAAVQAGRPPLDKDVMAVMEAARLVQIVALLPLDAQSPGLAAGLAGVVEMWRATAEYR